MPPSSGSRPSAAKVACTSALHFLSGVSWAVQRPQGFLLVLLQDAGLSEGEAGFISMSGLMAPVLGGPLLGLVADKLASGRQPAIIALSALVKAALQLVAWPALAKGDHALAFWGSLVAIATASAWNAGGILCSLTLAMVGQNGFGRVRLWGGLGFAAGSLLTGALASWIPSLGLWVVFLESTAVGLLTAGAALLLGHLAGAESGRELGLAGEAAARVEEEVKGEAAVAAPARLRDLFSGYAVVFYIIVGMLGVGEGIMQSYTYTRLELLPNGTSLVMGLSAAFMIASEVPFFYFSGQLNAKLGVMPILALALFSMFLRQAWIAVLWDARWVLPGELLHGITFSAANAAVVLHCQEIAPPALQATAQSVQGAVFNGFGMGGASLLGGALLETWGAARLFAASAGLALVSAFLPMGLWLRARRRRAPRSSGGGLLLRT